MRAEQVAVGGHGGQPGAGVDEVLGVLQGGDDDDPAQQPPHRGHQIRRSPDEGGGVRRPVGARFVRYVVGAAGEQQGGPAGVLLAQQADGVGGGRRGGDREGVGGRTEGGGQGDLVTGRHGEQFGGRAQQPGEPVLGGEHRPGAVLAAQSEGKRLVAGPRGRPLAFRHGGRLTGGTERGLRLGQPALGGIVALGEFLVVGVEAVDLGLERLVLLLRGGGPFPGLVPGLGQPLDLGLGRGGPRTCGADLSAEPGQPLTAVGDRPCGVLEAALLLGQLAFEVRAVGDGVLQGVLGRLQGRFEFRLLLADAGGLALQLLRIAAAALLGRRGGGALHPRLGQRHGAAHPLGELGQLVPGLLGALEARGQPADLVLQVGLAAQCLAQFPFGGLLALLERGLVGDLGLERLAQPYQVVGEEPEARVPQVGLDDGGPPRHRGLPAQRLELAPQLVGEVLHAREVGLHRVQLPERLLLALAVLEDARRLLDEGAAAHRVGVQDGVELALADDDVHLPADAGVGQEFLDVQEAAGVAVDLVLAAAVAEHDPRDGDLGVLDGQRPVGVVDGQRHLGPAERRAARGAGEDDVLHLAAAQRLGALFAHDPAERVHDVGLARAVRSDDAGDAGLEPERGRRGERFEPAQGQGLQVHAAGLYLSGMSHSMNR